MNRIKVLELFGGISAPHKALLNLGIETETVDYVEFDKTIVKIRNAIYQTDFESKTVVDYHCYKEIDLLIGGSPCVAFSNQGSKKGIDDPRAQLLWEQERILKETMPKFYIWENVANVLNNKNKQAFNNHLEFIKKLGYKVNYQVLDARDFGIPQMRKRLFLIGIRKDIKTEFNFDNLERKDMENIDKFLIDHSYIKLFKKSSFNSENYLIDKVLNTAHTLTATGALSRQKIKIGYHHFRIMTPLEMWLLMGFTQKDYEQAKHLPKLRYVAGNSIVVPVLEAIFKELLGGNRK